MADACECAVQGPYKGLLGDIEGDEIVEVEVIGGGHKYCNIITMKLKSGKFLQIKRDLDVSSYGISPRIEYNMGAWFSFNPKANVQLCFDFMNES